jgi:tetratricopeptide (TPR) repeat protein
VDAAVAPLLDPLLEAGKADDTLVVFTSDHGEGLGDHGEATHGIFAYESTLRVPLVLHNPRLFAPRSMSAGARHVDVLPTILDALALPLPSGLPGRSLLAAAQGLDQAGAADSYFESLTPALTRGWAPIHGVLRDRLKYVDLPIPELYDLGADPREQSNLMATRPAPVAEMRLLLGRFRAAGGAQVRGDEDPEARERLASLGYLDARRAVRGRYEEADDPKRNIAFESALEKVIGRYVEGDLAGALSSCETLVRDHPQVPLGLRHLSFLRSRAGNGAGALEAARTALRADPGSVEAAAELGHLLNDLGRPKEAVEALASLAARSSPDLDVLLTYGIALARTGQRDPALAALRRARQADPSSALAAYDLGTIHLLFGDHPEARKEFEAAIQLDPEMARAYGSLGVLSAVDGKVEEAIRLWTRGLALNPHDFDTLLNLGTLLWRLGRHGEARPHLERFLAAAPPARYAQDLAQVRAQLGRAR